MQTILFLESIYHLGGAERITYGIIQRMNRQLYRPVVCTLYEPGPVGEWFRRDGLPFYHDLIRSRYDCRAIWRLSRIIRREHVDLIYLINQPLTMFWGLMMGRKHGIPVVSVVHNTFRHDEAPKLRVTRRLMNRADALVAVADTQKQHLVRNESIAESRVRVIHNGVDCDQLQPRVAREDAGRSLGVDPTEPVVGIVARLVHLKGLDLLLSAASTVIRRFPKTQFVIVGDGPEAAALQARSRELGVEAQVRFVGSRDDIPDIVQVFDLAVLCSRTEALPMVILEYMALGKPVIATDVGGVREVVVDQETGLVIPPESPGDLAAAIETLLGDPEKRRRMGALGLARVRQQFSIAGTVAKTERLFAELLG